MMVCSGSAPSEKHGIDADESFVDAACVK